MRFTDTEQAFADSAEGRAAIARERMIFENSEAHKGSFARSWTDAMEATAAGTLSAQRARHVVSDAAVIADAERQSPILQARAETARAQMIGQLTTP